MPNTGLALHRLGIPIHLIAKVGSDPFGSVLLEIVNNHDPKLTEGITIDETESTSYTLIINPPGVDRAFLHFPGVNDTFCSRDIDYEVVANAHLFHFGYPPVIRRMYEADGDELVAVFHKAKSTGATTSLDTALPDPASEGGQANWRHILQKVLPSVDLFSPSIEELLYMLRQETHQELERAGSGDVVEAVTPELLTSLSDELFEMGTKVVLLKLGHRGAYLRTANKATLKNLGRAVPEDLQAWSNQEIWTPCFNVNVVGTTGSGDATIAGFLSAFLRHMSPEEAITVGVAVGACSVEAADSLSSLRGWDETLQRIKGGWPRHRLDLSAHGWHWEEKFGVWVNPVRTL